MSIVKKYGGVSRFKDRKSKKDFIEAYSEAFSSLPRPKEIIDADTSYGRVRVYHFEKEQANAKVPILLLHGRYTSSLMWKENLPDLYEEYPVYAVDIIGEPGLSIQTKPFIRSRDQALWLEELLSKLNLKEIHLIGASMGGWAAANYIRYYPKRVKSLTLLDPVFVFTAVSFKTVKQFLLFQLTKEKMIPFLISSRKKIPMTDPIGRTVSLGLRKFIYRTPIPYRLKKSDLEKISCPVLTIMAGKSPLHDAEKAVSTGKRLISDIEIENWKQASHALNFEHSEAVNRRILAFLGKHNQKPVK